MVNKSLSKRAELQNKFLTIKNQIALDNRLMSMLSYVQKSVLKNYLMSNDRSEFGICTELGISANELISEAEVIIQYVESILHKKQQTQYIIKHYGGRESLEDMAEFLPKEYKIVLQLYMLEEYPDLEKLKDEQNLSLNKLNDLETKVLELLDEMYPKKLKVDALIKSAGGKDYVYGTMADSLKQFLILRDYTLCYRKVSKRQISKIYEYTEKEITEEDKKIKEKLNKAVLVNQRLAEALADPSISGYRLKLSVEKIRKVLTSMPLLHQEFADEYFGDGLSLYKISKDSGLSSGTVFLRKKQFFEIFYELSQLRDSDLKVNKSARTLKITQRESRTSQMLAPYIAKLATFEPNLDPRYELDVQLLLEKYLYPYLNIEQKNIFDNYMLHLSGKSADVIAKEIGAKNYQRVYVTENFIYSKLDYIIDKKISIDNFYAKYDGQEGVEDFAKFLTPVQKIVLDNYFLSLDPNSNSKTLKLLERKETGKNGFGSIREGVIAKFNELLSRKRECQKFIKENGGIEFLTEFSKTLSKEHKEIFETVVLDYHYISLRDISLKYGANDGFARKVRSLVLKKLEKVQEKAKWIQSLYENLSEYDIEKFSKNLNERELNILIKFTLNCFMLSLSDYCKLYSENHSYASDVNSRLVDKLQKLSKVYS